MGIFIFKLEDGMEGRIKTKGGGGQGLPLLLGICYRYLAETGPHSGGLYGLLEEWCTRLEGWYTRLEGWCTRL